MMYRTYTEYKHSCQFYSKFNYFFLNYFNTNFYIQYSISLSLTNLPREALEREKDLRAKRGDDAAKLTQVEKASREQIEHLTRKCACLRKLFDDMRARLTARERAAAEESRAKDKEVHHLRAEVARLTKLLVEQGSQKLGARTRADGCEKKEETEEQTQRRKGGILKTPEVARKRPTLPDLEPLPPELKPANADSQNGRRRAKSVDLPAVQVPVRIKQLENINKEQS